MQFTYRGIGSPITNNVVAAEYMAHYEDTSTGTVWIALDTAIPTNWVKLATYPGTGTLPVAIGGTNSGTALSGSSVMVSNGAAIVQGPAGTATTVLHGNAAGLPSYSAVNLTTDVSGILPTASGGSGTATPALVQGSGVTITGAWPNQTISATGTGGTVTSVSVTTGNGVSATVTNPTTTPALAFTLGAITPTTVNGLTISSTTGTLTISNGKTLSATNTLAFSGTDGTTMTFPTTSQTIPGLGVANAFTQAQRGGTASGTITGAVTINLGALTASSVGITWTGSPVTANHIELTATGNVTSLTVSGGATGTVYNIFINFAGFVAPGSVTNADFGAAGLGTFTTTTGKQNLISGAWLSTALLRATMSAG